MRALDSSHCTSFLHAERLTKWISSNRKIQDDDLHNGTQDGLDGVPTAYAKTKTLQDQCLSKALMRDWVTNTFLLKILSHVWSLLLVFHSRSLEYSRTVLLLVHSLFWQKDFRELFPLIDLILSPWIPKKCSLAAENYSCRVKIYSKFTSNYFCKALKNLHNYPCCPTVLVSWRKGTFFGTKFFLHSIQGYS